MKKISYNKAPFRTFSSSLFRSVIASSSATPIVYGPYELLAESEVTGSAVTSIDFTGLTLDSDDELILVSDIVNDSGSTSAYSLYVNNDTTATNYYVQSLYSTSTTNTAARTNNSVYATVETSDKLLAETILKLTASSYFIYQSNIVRRYGASDVSLQDIYCTKTATISSITQLTVSASVASSIGIGSKFWLFKVGDDVV